MKRFSKKRSEAVLKLRDRKTRGRPQVKKKVTLTYGKVRMRKNEVALVVPSNFSLIGNPEEMLSFFHDVNIYVEKGEHIFFDMAAIDKMTTDAILYMLSQFEYYKHRYKNYVISGNVPAIEECRDIFISSGFYKYVRASNAGLQSNANVLTVRSGSQVEPEVARDVTYFARDRLANRDTQISKSMYSTMIECMANTKNHAYKSLGGKWWLMAAYREQAKAVHFTFLDNGITIPVTIKKNFKEYVANIAGTILPVVQTTQDCKLIESALKGEFRTTTGMSYRGKGLPKIYQYSRNKNIENLAVVSRNGYIDLASATTYDLNKKFFGTLLSWDFV